MTDPVIGATRADPSRSAVRASAALYAPFISGRHIANGAFTGLDDIWGAPSDRWSSPMLDLAYIAITIGFFAACAVSVRLIERL